MKITNLQNLMVSIGMLKDKAYDLLNIGLPRVFRTRAEQAALTALYEAKAKEKTPNRDLFRLNRTDAAGNQQADGGDQLFKTEGQKMVTPKNLVADLTKFGFHLAVAEIFQKEGDEDRLKLRLTWSKSSSAKVELNDEQKKVIRRYFDQAYWKLFGLYNPEATSLEGDENPIEGSITTLNFSGVMNAQQEARIREVRMADKDGHLACPILTPTAKGESSQESPRFADLTPQEAFDQDLPREDENHAVSSREPRQICPSRPARHSRPPS